MKRFSLIAVCFIFTAVFSISAFGQVPAAQPGTNVKIVVINTAAFDAKDGIVKYANAMNALEKEIAPTQAEINTAASRYTTLGTEIKTLQEQIAAGKVPVDQKTADAKVEEYQTLELKIKRLQEDGKRKFDLRQSQIMGPVLQDIGKAMDDFAKQKGYALILDASKLEGAGLILAVDAAKLDVTKDFITFYNARPAGTATTTVPK